MVEVASEGVQDCIQKLLTVVPAEHCLQSFELEEGLHERNVLVRVGVHGLGAALAGRNTLNEPAISKVPP